MNGIILAAGRGSRLGPLTAWQPKALLPVVTVPAIDYPLASLARQGAHRIGVNLHHLAEPLARHLERRGRLDDTEVVTSLEDDLLGTAGGIRRLARRIGGQRLIVHNADILADIDLDRMVARHVRTKATATLATTDRPNARPTLRVASGHAVVDILQALDRQASTSDYLGVCVLEAGFARALPERGCLVRDGFIPLLRQGGRITAWEHPGYWQDLGTPARLLAAQLAVLRGQMVPAGGPSERIRAALQRGRSVRPAVTLIPPIAIGKGVVLEPGASIGPDVILSDRSRIESGCHLESTLVLEETCVAAGTRVAGAIIMPHRVLAVPS